MTTPDPTTSCTHPVRPYRVEKNPFGFEAYCDVCGERVGIFPTEEEAKFHKPVLVVHDTAADMAYHLWRVEGVPLHVVCMRLDVEPEMVALIFKEREPAKFYLYTAKAFLGFALAVLYLLAREGRKTLGRMFGDK